MSKEHIEREATCKDCFHYNVCANPCTKYYYRVPCRKFVNSADVEPVRHGEWDALLKYSPKLGCSVILGYFCSLCNRDNKEETNHCPHCGAKMDGGK